MITRAAFDCRTTPSFERGESFDLSDIAHRLMTPPRPGWLWFVHCETSTGVLDDLDGIRRLCVESGVKLCVDAISSVGTLPVSLAGVALASAVSGKGLSSFPGLALVFHEADIQPAPERLPRYLDLGLYAGHDGVPFTQSSNLVRALGSALTATNSADRCRRIAADGAWLRQRLREFGFDVIAPDNERRRRL